MKKAFPTEVVLSCVGGKLLCEMQGVYELLSFLTGRQLFTHQLPAAFKECAPMLRAQLPQLADYDDESVTKENWQQWRDAQIACFGASLEVVPLNSPRDYASPIGDLVELMQGREDKVIVLEADA